MFSLLPPGNSTYIYTDGWANILIIQAEKKQQEKQEVAESSHTPAGKYFSQLQKGNRQVCTYFSERFLKSSF